MDEGQGAGEANWAKDNSAALILKQDNTRGDAYVVSLRGVWLVVVIARATRMRSSRGAKRRPMTHSDRLLYRAGFERQRTSDCLPRLAALAGAISRRVFVATSWAAPHVVPEQATVQHRPRRGARS